MVNVTTLMIAKGVVLVQDKTIKINILRVNMSNQRTACEQEHEVNSFLLDDMGVPGCPHLFMNRDIQLPLKNEMGSRCMALEVVAFVSYQHRVSYLGLSKAR